MKYGQNSHEDVSVSSHYSEWPDGAALITREWELDSESIPQATSRPYKWHSHYRGQLLCIQSGLIRIYTDTGNWVLPPHRAGWIPPGASHKLELCGNLTGRSLLFTPESCKELSKKPCVIAISEVLQALATRTVSWNKTDELCLEQKHMLDVIIDEIRSMPSESLYLPMPKDPRLERITLTILNNPVNNRSIEQWAVLGHMSSRTLRRLIRKETGLGFSEWRQQAQLSHAMEKLSRGISITEIADSLGYASASNFIAMFRRAFGDSPARYFSKHSGQI